MVNEGGWKLIYNDYNPKDVGKREALSVLGNGVFATRGAAEEMTADGIHYPATYVAGAFNRLEDSVEGQKISNESLVNFPNWLPITFKTEDSGWFTFSKDGSNVKNYKLELDMHNGILNRQMVVVDDKGREFEIISHRIVNVHNQNPHVAGIQYNIKCLNWSGDIQIRSSIYGSVENAGVPRYKELGSKHLRVKSIGAAHNAVAGEEKEKDPSARKGAEGTEAIEGIYVHVKTITSRVEVCVGARTRIFSAASKDDKHMTDITNQISVDKEDVHQIFTLPIKQGEKITVEKMVALYSSFDKGFLVCKTACLDQMKWLIDFGKLRHYHTMAWNLIWDGSDISLKGTHQSGDLSKLQMNARLHIFHLYQTVSSNTIGYDVGVAARGLHGESYRGHIFWDEIFILPFYTIHAPEMVKTLIKYRYNRMLKARHMAAQKGYAGALFPWQSGSDGREESQTVHFNPVSKTWGPDASSLQRHVNIAIAYNIIRFSDSAKDGFFMEQYGAEMLIDICRLFVSLSTYNRDTDRYEIKGVMGPDEFHEGYPNTDKPGLNNNTYTNVMVVWLLRKAVHALRGNQIREQYKKRLMALMNVKTQEVELWDQICHKMTIPFHSDGVWSQFEGYEDLKEFDWEGYRKKCENIERLDRILKAEKDSPDNYKVSKQPDVCMLFYLLTEKELREIFEGLSYKFPEGIILKNVEYYLPRTSHGSTISKMVFSRILQKYDSKQSWDMYLDCVRGDMDDVQGGTTTEGVHLALMAGTLYILINGYAGVDTSQDVVSISPNMPDTLSELKFTIQHRGSVLDVVVNHNTVQVTSSVHFFPIIVQGKLMLASRTPFTKRITGQPLAKPLPQSSRCSQCDTDVPFANGKECRACGKDTCTACLTKTPGYYTYVADNLDVCVKCSQEFDKKATLIKEQSATPSKEPPLVSAAEAK